MNIEIILNVFLTCLVCWLIVFIPFCVENWNKDINKNNVSKFVTVWHFCFSWAVIVSGLFLVFAWIWG